MSLWVIAATEWRRLLRNRLARLGVLAIVFVPILYSGLYLYAFWDPYGTLEKLPIALVNLDEGGVDQGQPVHLGDQLSEQLLEKVGVDWHVTNAQQAQAGVEGDRYYLVVTIPSSFSRDILSIRGDHPRKAQLIFTLNEGKNYITSQISKRLESEIREKIGNRLTFEYVQNLLKEAEKAKGGLQRASSAADQLAQGADRLAKGSLQIQKATEKAAKASQSLEQGANRLVDGTSRLSNSAEKLATAMDTLARKFRHAEGDLPDTGLRQRLKAGSARLYVLETRLNRIRSDWEAVENTVRQARYTLSETLTANPALKQDPKLQALEQQLGGLESRLSQLPSRLDQFRRHLTPLKAEIEHLLRRWEQLKTRSTRLEKAGRQLSTGTTRLHQGARQLRNGTSSLSDGLGKLAQQTKKWTAGAEELARGNRELARRLSGAVTSARKKALPPNWLPSCPIRFRRRRSAFFPCHSTDLDWPLTSCLSPYGSGD